MKTNKADDTEKMEEKIFAAAILVKYVGFAVFGLSLTAIIIGSFLRFTLPYTTDGMLVGIFLIFLGYVAEMILSRESKKQ